MHSICFISDDLPSNSKQVLFSKSCSIATGCEDGTVRLTGYVFCSNQTREMDGQFCFFFLVDVLFINEFF